MIDRLRAHRLSLIHSSNNKSLFNSPELSAHLRVERITLNYKLGIGGVRTEEEYRRKLTKVYDLLDAVNPKGSAYLMHVLKTEGRNPIRVIHQIRRDVETGRVLDENYVRPLILS